MVKGVWQGCILALTLFVLCDLSPFLSKVNVTDPSLGERKTNIMLCAEDVSLLLLTRQGFGNPLMIIIVK